MKQSREPLSKIENNGVEIIHVKEKPAVDSKTAELSAQLKRTSAELENKKKAISVYEKSHAKIQQVESENSVLKQMIATLQSEAKTKVNTESERCRKELRTVQMNFLALQNEHKLLLLKNASLQKSKPILFPKIIFPKSV